VFRSPGRSRSLGGAVSSVDGDPRCARFPRAMTKSILALLLSASAVALLASACSDDSSGYEYSRGWRGYEDGCHQYASCGSCTPVAGCGWCTTGVGQGMCAADPNECAGAQAFSWTWDPSGCFAPPVDAGVVAPVDAAANVPVSPTDAAAVPAQVDSGIPEPQVDAGAAGGNPAH
jgi:hypothetical protein